MLIQEDHGEGVISLKVHLSGHNSFPAVVHDTLIG